MFNIHDLQYWAKALFGDEPTVNLKGWNGYMFILLEETSTGQIFEQSLSLATLRIAILVLSLWSKFRNLGHEPTMFDLDPKLRNSADVK